MKLKPLFCIFALSGCHAPLPNSPIQTQIAKLAGHQPYAAGPPKVSSRAARRPPLDSVGGMADARPFPLWLEGLGDEGRIWPRVSVTLKPGMALRPLCGRLVASAGWSLSVEEDVPAQGNVTFAAQDQPFPEVMEALCHVLRLRLTRQGSLLVLSRDTPYLRTHTVPFLQGQRDIRHHSTVTTDMGNFNGKGGRLAHTLMAGHTTSDFWGELDKTLTLILTPPLKPPLSLPQGAVGEDPGNPPDGAQPPEARELPAQSPPESPPQGLALAPDPLTKPVPGLRLDPETGAVIPTSIPSVVRGSAPRRRSLPSPLPGPPKALAPFAIHRQTGLITVWGTELQHKAVQRYLHQLWSHSQAQVMIEAKIVEVSLKSACATGINWGLFSPALPGVASLASPALPSFEGEGLVLRLRAQDMRAALAFMERFGAVRTLSNPRLLVLNNQQALIKVAKNEVFFTLSTEKIISSDTRPHLQTLTSHMQTVPVGLVMAVQPAIDLARGRVTLSLRPSLSRVVESREDPAVALTSDNTIHSAVPVIQVRELDSVITLAPGEIAVIGGLMEDTQRDETTSLPGLSHTPLAPLLGSHQGTHEVSELVIFLQVHLKDPRS